MIRYEYWEHRGGEHYLVRLDDANRVTGVCGPLRHARIPAENMPNYDYNAQPQHAAWVQRHSTEFHCVS